MRRRQKWLRQYKRKHLLCSGRQRWGGNEDPAQCSLVELLLLVLLLQIEQRRDDATAFNFDSQSRSEMILLLPPLCSSSSCCEEGRRRRNRLFPLQLPFQQLRGKSHTCRSRVRR